MQVLGGKSPVTLKKRASCAKEAKDAGQSPEIFRFVKHALSYDECDEMLDSPWANGVVRGAEAAKKERQQSRVLTAKEFLAFCVGGTGCVQRASLQVLYAAGVFLLRFAHELGSATAVPLAVLNLTPFDGSEYLEVRTMEHKNIRVAPVRGLCAQSWLTAFAETGLASGKEGPGPLRKLGRPCKRVRACSEVNPCWNRPAGCVVFFRTNRSRCRLARRRPQRIYNPEQGGLASGEAGTRMLNCVKRKTKALDLMPDSGGRQTTQVLFIRGKFSAVAKPSG